MLTFVQSVNACKKDKNAEQLSIEKPAPDQRVVEHISGNNVCRGDQHDDKDQVTGDFTGLLSDGIYSVKKRLGCFRHDIKPLLTAMGTNYKIIRRVGLHPPVECAF
jgi:hypothetical protein